MNNPGCYTLAALGITTALTSSAQTAIADLEGMTALSLVAALSYGSGGTTVTATIATSFDGGTVWLEIARFDFTTSSETKVANLSGLLSKAVTAYAALNANTVFDGVLGARLRCVVSSSGTYANTTLSVRASVR